MMGIMTDVQIWEKMHSFFPPPSSEGHIWTGKDGCGGGEEGRTKKNHLLLPNIKLHCSAYNSIGALRAAHDKHIKRFSPSHYLYCSGEGRKAWLGFE